jgi:hypothetical protein
MLIKDNQKGFKMSNDNEEFKKYIRDTDYNHIKWMVEECIDELSRRGETGTMCSLIRGTSLAVEGVAARQKRKVEGYECVSEILKDSGDVEKCKSILEGVESMNNG